MHMKFSVKICREADSDRYPLDPHCYCWDRNLNLLLLLDSINFSLFTADLLFADSCFT